MTLSSIILVINIAATLYMVGLIWFVQLVHYPLMAKVGEDAFPTYQDLHQKWTTLAVGPPMLAEAFSSILLIWFPPIPNAALLLLGVALLFIIWVSTALLQVPCHGQLAREFDKKVHRQLVLTNWLRTAAWSLRGVLVCWFVIDVISNAGLK